MGRMRGDLLLFTAGEETDVRVKLCVGTAHQDLSIRPFLRLQYLFQPGCQGVEGLGGAGRALDDGQGHFLRRHPYHLGPDAGDHIPAHQRRRRPLVHKAPAYFQHPARPTVWIQSLGQICVHMVDFQAHGAPTGQGHAFYKVARKPQTL